MNFKRILVLVMTFAMLLSTFAPTLGVFAGNYKETTTNEKLNYVSIGDSMTNGYGFEGYLQGSAGHDFLNGNGTYGQGSYALQFEKYLENQGYDVTHTKLAASALRAEDLLYLLGGMDQPTDDWFEEVVYYSTGAKDFSVVPQLATHYQNAVKNADVITLGIGNASFGAFMLSRVTSALGVMGGSLDDEQLEMYTLENALDLLEDEAAKEKILEIYNKLFDELNKYVDENTAATYKLETVCEIVAYIGARFLTSYAKSIDKIVELNESENLEIMLVGLMNTTYGMTITLDDGTPIYFGDIMDEIFGLLNAYIAAYPTAQQAAGNYKGVTFYYAENTQPDFIVNALPELADGWTNTDGGRLSANIVRSRTITTYNETLRIMIAAAMFYEDVETEVINNMMNGMEYDDAFNAAIDTVLPPIDLKQVQDWKSWNDIKDAYREYISDIDYYPEVAAFELMHNDSKVTTSVAIYLAIEDAIINSVKVEDIPVSGLETIADQNQLLGIFNDIGDIDDSPYTVREGIATHLSKPQYLPLVKIFAIFKIGDGMCVHSTPTGHDATYEAIVESYENDWTAQKQTVKNIYEYYMNAYQFADDNGYIDLSINAIDEAIKAIKLAIVEVDAGLLGVTDELKAELIKELYATIETLEELRDVLDSDSASDVDGLVAAIFALEDDLYTHLANIYAILEQAAIDVNQLVLAPAFKEAMDYINTVVIPEIIETAERIIDDVVEYVTAKVDAAYREIIAILVRVQLHVQEKLTNALNPIINAYYELVDVLTEIYGTVEEAIRIAGIIFDKLVELDAKLNGALSKAMDKVVDLFITLFKAYGSVEDALLALNNILLNIVNTVEGTIENVIAAYNALVNKLYEIYGNIEKAIAKAHEIYNNIVATVNGAIEKGIELYNAILNTLIDVYGTVENVVTVAGQLFSYVYDFIANNLTFDELETFVNDIVAIVTDAYGTTKDAYYVVSQVYAYILKTVENAFEGNYVVTDDSMYVSLGNAVYGKELANMLKLGNKYYNFDLAGNYLDKVAQADLITIKLDNGEAIAFAMNQIQNPTVLDWDKYLDAEGQEALNEILADVKAELLANGKAQEFADKASETLALPGVALTPVIVADLIAYTIECTLYSYAEFIDRMTVVLENVYAAAPNATVVLTSIQNPLEDLDLSAFGLDIDLGEYSKAVDVVVAGLNLNLVAVALANENTIYVDSNDAQDIYDALNVEFALTETPACVHVYDDCFDTTCNLCGEVRVAPGHSFTNYVKNNDATCDKNATETAKCDNCDATSTREIANTALGHQYGEWVVVKEATTDAKGLEERECKVCGHKESREIAPISKERKVSPWMIAAVVGLLVICIMIKKPSNKKANKKNGKKSGKKSGKKTTSKKTSKKK